MTVDEILVKIDGDMSGLRKDLDRIEKHTKAKTAAMGAAFKRVGIAIAAVASAAAMGSFIKSTIQVGSSVEGLRVQLKGLLGSAEEGEKAFAAMNEFASRVPFSLGQIQAASGSLAAASKNAEGMADMMQVTGNIAAQFNIPFELAAENVQRALSAGAASADLFQQKGVNAMMGFQAGVSYSSEETAKKLFEFFGKGGKFDGAMDEFALTTGGAVSMFDDALNKFQTKIAESGLNEGFAEFINQMTEVFNGSGKLAEAIGETLGSAFRGLASAVQFINQTIGPISATFRTFGALVGTVASIIVTAFGPPVRAAMDAFKIALGFIVDNMNFLVIGVAAFAGYNMILRFKNLAGAAFNFGANLLYAANNFAKFNKTALKATAAIVALAVGLEALGLMDDITEVLEKSLTDFVNKHLPEDLRIQFKDMVMTFGELEQGINKAATAIHNASMTAGSAPAEVIGNAGDVARETAKTLEEMMANLRGAGSSDMGETASSITDKIIEENAKLADQMAQLTVGAANYTDAQIRMNEIKRNNRDLNAVEIAQLEDLVNRNEDLKLKLEELQLQKEGMEEFSKSLEGAMQQAGDAVSNKLADALVEGEFSLKSFRDIFKNFVKEMIAQAIKMFVIKTILNAIFGGPAGGTGAAASGSSGLSNMGAVTMGYGSVATGGSISRRQPYLVGERGPEIIIPRTASTVLNSNNTRSAMRDGGSPVVVNQNINVSTGVQETVRAEVISLLPVIRESTVEAVSSRVQRGGSYQRAIRG